MAKGAAVAVMLALGAAGCGGATRTVTITTTAPPVTTAGTATTTPSATTRPTTGSDEVLAIPTVGRFYGRCPRAARVWTLRFMVPSDSATDTISSKIGNGRLRRVNVSPGGAVTFDLLAGAVRTSEPTDRLARHPATTVATTPPLDVHIFRGTEPQSLRVDVHLALATIGGETAQCVLVGSRVNARTYFNGPP
jgi:hypothetical protein